MASSSFFSRLYVLMAAFCLCSALSFAAPAKKHRAAAKKATQVTARSKAKKGVLAKKTSVAGRREIATRSRYQNRARVGKSGSARTGVKLASRRGRKSRHLGGSVVLGGPWSAPTFADSTIGDNVNGEDLIVRRAAVEALGPYNGSVVVADPHTGRVLSIVNQALAFQSGFQPCSTIKIVAALAGLNERVIDRDTNVHLYGRVGMNLTNALAHSNNSYFANIGIKLGYDKVAHYAKLFGLGEKAGLNIAAEQPGFVPSAPPANGGMGMMTSFGEGIKLTPLQLTALLSAMANGGTMYYLQHPTSVAEVQHFEPKVKRQLDIKELVPDVMPGMQGAVEFGTARRAGYDPAAGPIFGKTGTCTDRATPTHLGWFGSFMEYEGRKLVVVVLLTGGRNVNGPIASGIAGSVYHNLNQQSFLANYNRGLTPATLLPGTSW